MEVNNMTLGVIIMFVLTSVAVGASVWGNTTTGSDSQVTANESNISNNFETLKTVNGDISAIKGSIAELKKLFEVAEHTHKEYAPVSHGHSQYSQNTHTHTTTTTGSNEDFDLYTSIDSRGDNEENRFNDGERIYIHGYNDSNERSVEWEIRDPDNDKIYSRNTGITAFDAFFLQYEIPDDAERGTYTVIVEIDRDEDEIQFIVD